MPKHKEKNSQTPKASEATSQANANPTETPEPSGPNVTSNDLLEAIKELRSDLKGDNDQLRKSMDSIRREMSNKLDSLTEEVQGLKEQMGEMETRLTQVEDWATEVSGVLATAMQREENMQRKLTDLESRSRRNNIRIFGVPEGEEGSSVTHFASELIKREFPAAAELELKIQRAHRSLAPRPRSEAPPRPLIVNFQEFTTKELVLREAWKKGKVQLGNRTLFFDHDYATEIVQKRREYNGLKKALKERNIRFQTPYTNMRINWDDGTQTYNSAHEAGLELKRRGFTVAVPEEREQFDSVGSRLKELLGWQRQEKSRKLSRSAATGRAKEILRRFERSDRTRFGCSVGSDE
ncbi:uncharacterized protein LOC143519059 isoform X2 [Brachyhypopomus gauderio]|uniref:uncharacterized protein LOC143519059 isoform X2 n=1 Tax=Brachyhypopomus gauderio TaxID=698409 RepID=UPI0040423FBC